MNKYSTRLNFLTCVRAAVKAADPLDPWNYVARDAMNSYNALYRTNYGLSGNDMDSLFHTHMKAHGNHPSFNRYPDDGVDYDMSY